MYTTSNEVRFETSTLCNYKCQFCPHHISFSRKKEIMSYDLFISLLEKVKEQLPQITECTISGFGEALLDKDIINKFVYAKYNGYNIHLLTNGSRLTEENIDDLLLMGINDIRISLHTLNTHNYMSITKAKEKDHYHVVNIIDYIVNHKNKKKTNLIITADIVKENEGDVQELIDELSEKVDVLEIWKPHNWSDWANYRNGRKKKTTCGRPWNGPIQIQVDGTVNMCCFDYNGKLTLGDLKTQTFSEIENGEMMQKIRSLHKGSEEKNLICEKCDQLYDLKDIVIYNSKFDSQDRIGKLSTTYKEI